MKCEATLAGAERSSAPDRYYTPGRLQFLTSSTYRRSPLLTSEGFHRDFVEILEQVRREMGFRLIGGVLMPEHFHLLVWPDPAESTNVIMQEVKKRTAHRW